MALAATPLTSPVVLDADQLKQIGIDLLTARMPGYIHTAGDAWDLELTAIAQMMSYGLAQYADPTTAVVQAVGAQVYGIQPFPAVSAAGTVTIITDGTAGTVPAGTYLAATDPSGNPVQLQTTADTVVATGDTSTAGVAVIVSDPGADGNSLTGTVQVLDRVAFVVAASLDSPTSGGTDPETTTAYAARTNEFARLIAPRLILPQDFAAGARLLSPGVARALAIDLYEASTNTAGVERCVTVVVMDEDGNDLQPDQLTALQATLTAFRETTFEVFVINPTRTSIDAIFSAVAAPGNDPAAVQAGALAAIADLLNPRLHGIPDSGDPSQWVDRSFIYFQDVVTALNNVKGLDRYTSLTLNGATDDVPLAGPGAVPAAGTVIGSVL